MATASARRRFGLETRPRCPPPLPPAKLGLGGGARAAGAACALRASWSAEASRAECWALVDRPARARPGGPMSLSGVSPRGRSPSPAAGGAGGGVDVRFSDDRFLQRILQEAARGGVAGNEAASRLEGMGFGPQVARVALHVTGGDERRALELCMSGLAFVSPGPSKGAGASRAPGEKQAGPFGHRAGAPPTPLRCYICGQRHLTSKSLEIHVKACGKRFEQREAKKPLSARRALLEEAELPPGAECVEQHYELAGGPPREQADGRPGTRERFGAARRSASPGEDRTSRWAGTPAALLPCEFCGRTFDPGRLQTHQRACGERPKVPAPPPPRRRPRALSPGAPPTGGGVRAYEAFCSQLARCPGCARQFRPEALQSHQRPGAPSHPSPAVSTPPRSRGESASGRTSGGNERKVSKAGQYRPLSATRGSAPLLVLQTASPRPPLQGPPHPKASPQILKARTPTPTF